MIGENAGTKPPAPQGAQAVLIPEGKGASKYGDEGKTFDVDTVFVCAKTCQYNGRIWTPGQTWKGRKCPPNFKVAVEKKEEKSKK